MSRYVNSQISINDALATEFSIKRQGRFKTNCPNPEHRDSDASFEVYGEEKGGYCFGCGKPYFPLDIIMFSRDINYYQALAVAEDEYGAELPQESDAVKKETKADSLRYQKVRNIEIKTRKGMHNLCLALQAVADEDDTKFNKYCKLKKIGSIDDEES